MCRESVRPSATALAIPVNHHSFAAFIASVCCETFLLSQSMCGTFIGEWPLLQLSRAFPVATCEAAGALELLVPVCVVFAHALLNIISSSARIKASSCRPEMGSRYIACLDQPVASRGVNACCPHTARIAVFSCYPRYTALNQPSLHAFSSARDAYCCRAASCRTTATPSFSWTRSSPVRRPQSSRS
eukprot:6192824-Pleurochrysis_carterae.AAC.1